MHRPFLLLVALAALPAFVALPAGAFPVTASGGGQAPTVSSCSAGGVTVTVSNNLGTGNYDYWRITNGSGTVLFESSLSPQSAWNNFGPGTSGASISISPAQPVGTVIGVYYSIGDSPSTAANTGEWFAKYTCGATAAESVAISSCFGQLGTCPKSAADAPSTTTTTTTTTAPAAVTLQPTFTG